MAQHPDQWQWDDAAGPAGGPHFDGVSSGAGPGGHFGTPPWQAPRPGIIPLRPLHFGEFFEGAFRAISHNPRVMIGLPLIVAVISGLVQASLSVVLLSRMDQLEPLLDNELPYSDPTIIATLLVIALVVAVLGTVIGLATLIVNGLLVNSVAQSILGRRPSPGEVWRDSKGQMWRLIGLTLVIGLIEAAIAAVIAVAFVLWVAAALRGMPDSMAAITAIMLFIGVIAGVFAMVFFYVRLGLAIPALMMEKTTIGRAISRSWRLTKDFVWRNIGVLLVSSLIVSAISGVVAVPVSMFAGLVTVVPSAWTWLAIGLGVFLSSLVAAITTPFQAGITSLLYVDLRIRKESLHEDLARAAGL